MDETPTPTLTDYHLEEIESYFDNSRPSPIDPLPWKRWGAQLRSRIGREVPLEEAELDQSRLVALFEPRREPGLSMGSHVANLYYAQLACNLAPLMVAEIRRLRALVPEEVTR